MLNKNQERELAYVVTVDAIEPIPGKDRVECARVGGWTCMVPKGAMNVGDPAIYIEIDSLVPLDKEVFSFCGRYNGKIKTQKFRNSDGSQFWSQGLLMAASDFGWTINGSAIVDDKGVEHNAEDESKFLTKQLGITYYEAEDNKRKAKSEDKYAKMAKRMGKKCKKFPYRQLLKYNWGKKLLFLFFGKKRDKKNGWPGHIASKTDVERIQNMIWILKDKQPFVASEKVDGSSFSVMAEKVKFGKIKYYVCSRNVVFEDEDQKCYYDDNIYWEAYKKYNMKEKITQILNDYHLQNVAIQSEVFGPAVQRRDYSLSEREIRVFHIVSNNEKFPMDKVVEICEKYDLPHVPIINDNYILPDTIEELQAFVESEGSKIDGKEKEGIVFYDKETGQQYFKFVSPEFLLKYHS